MCVSKTKMYLLQHRTWKYHKVPRKLQTFACFAISLFIQINASLYTAISLYIFTISNIIVV